MEFFNNIIERLRNLSIDDVFPLNKDPYDVAPVLKAIGIYLGAIILMALLWVLLGHIFILGVIIKIIAVVVCLYAVVGTLMMAFQFMKYN